MSNPNATHEALRGSFIISVGVCALLLANLHADAATSKLDRELSARLERTLRGDIWKNKDAKGFVSEFYSVDALGTMEGAPTIWRGQQALTKLMVDVMNEYPSIDYQVHSTSATGPGSAYQFVLLHAPANGKLPELNLKCLYVWKKASHGWRVAADMCANGGMDR